MDVSFTVTSAAIGTVLLPFGIWAVKGKISEAKGRRVAFEKHISDCKEKEKNTALLEAMVYRHEQQIEADRRARNWIGDSIVKIATKMEIPLDPRPE